MATGEQSLGRLRTRTTRLGGLTTARVISLVVVGLISAAIGYTGYERVTYKAPAPPVQTAVVQRGSIIATVTSTGSIVPTQQAKLTFQTSGRVKEVNAKLGDKVTAGQVLAKLDPTQLQIKLEQAQSSLDAAQLKLNQAQHSVRPEELAAAQAAVDSAQAKYDQLMAGPSDAELKAAADRVTTAEAALSKAQDKLTTLKNAPDPNDVKAAEQDVEKAKASLWSTQLNRDGVCGQNDKAYNCFAGNANVMSAEISVAQAQNKLDILKAGSSPLDIAAAEKDVLTAQAGLETAQAALEELRKGPKPADIQAAAASLSSAKSALATKTQPLTETDLATYQQSIHQAQIGVKQSQLDLDNATLVAPFAGIVSAITMNAGEQTGSTAITLVDPSSVRIDGSVDETDVSKIKVGQDVQITFDAIPGRQFSGKVIAVAPSATVQQGVVNYVISVSVDPAGATLPGSMTAAVNIITDRQDNVLVVPNRTVRNQGRNKVVEVQTADGKPETRQVQIGMSNDQSSEVRSGLVEGDVVIIPATTTAAPRIGGPGMGGGPVIMGGPGRGG